MKSSPGAQIKHLQDIKRKDEDASRKKYSFERTVHMTTAGLTTGLLTHYWYIWLDRFVGEGRTMKLVFKKIVYDQFIFAPAYLILYFVTVGILERSSIRHVKEEIINKGFGNLYIADWCVWPPAQFINFYLLPLRYRLLFDSMISFGFRIYIPYVLYKPSSQVSLFNFSSSASTQSDTIAKGWFQTLMWFLH